MTDTKEESTPTLPKQLIVIRHGEKNKSAKSKDNPGCSKAGLARANYLADFFLTPNSIFQKPDIIYVFQKTKKPDPLLNRSVQLATPLIKIGQYQPNQVNSEFDDGKGDTTKMVNDIFSPSNAGKVVLCIWEHSEIPNIIQEAGKIIAAAQGHSKPLFSHFKGWNLDPTKAKDDGDLYSLTVVINTATSNLVAINQSNNFSKDESVLNPDPTSFTKILFSM
jgi:hypothetical protein